MRKFKTESKKLLDLMINSIYTNREIFLRELISNASDAIDKLYLKSLTDSSVRVDQANLAINVAFDKDARTITVSDNGIGMTAEELEKNLGTIAHSGSEEFKAANAEAQGDAVDIIGRFGVGFYSAFMVAKEVTVVTRAWGSDECNRWTSDGIEGYTIEPVAADDPAYRAACGSDVILTLKDNVEEASYDEFLSEWKLRELIKKYSNYVRYPVKMLVTKSREKEKPADAGDDYKPEWEDYTELETINSMTPIWKKHASEVTDEEYAEFYKSTFHDWADPARTFSLHAEGALEYDALLFIPGQAPFDLYSRDYEKGLELYSSNVLIMEKCADLLPDYYNFVRGVVDSSDVSLNISRETLQQTRQLQAMARRIEKKITSELEAMRNDDREAYEKFFENFGRGLKYGIYSSYGMKKDELAGLLLFWSAREQKMVTLQEYVAAMADGQKAIYYAAGDDRDRLAKMPVVEAVLAKGYDVLLATQDVDEFCFQTMRDFTAKGLPKVYETDAEREAAEKAVADGAEPELEDRTVELKNVTSGDLDLASDEEKKEAEEATKANEGLFDAMKDALAGQVEKVAVSTRLAADGAPAVITSEGPLSLEMEKVLAAGPEAEQAPKAVRVLEVNAKHPVFEKLRAAQEAGDAEKVKLYAGLLYNQALLVEGILPEDPVAFATQVCELM
ncbi:molecular chaperone HtpG [Thermophilibacter provencensis]|uniref:Chaperone protein HtpG n=1 Tax=Thermophilibacter provencensis TaxID=1852386 RepID=A0ABT7V0D6_9ACTN|nr:molecular chaperone HtpG [Thermophilibacter provencensis]MDM8270074.1 molecular chaperone HtpG [Thermophilibacter provencensis]